MSRFSSIYRLAAFLTISLLVVAIIAGCGTQGNPMDATTDEAFKPATSPLEKPATSVAVSPQTEGVVITMAISPHALVLGLQGVWVTVHADIPYGLVAVGTLTLDGIPAEFAFPDDRGDLVVKFNQSEIKAIVSPPEAVLTLNGAYKTGEPFTGSDTILVKETGKK